MPSLDERKKSLENILGRSIDPAELWGANAREVFLLEMENNIKLCNCCREKVCDECMCDLEGCPNFYPFASHEEKTDEEKENLKKG